MKTKEIIGVALLNLGGPETLSDVEPFLYNLFADRGIIRLGPSFMQKPLARFIAWRRAPKSKIGYEYIGGGSPLNRITTLQAKLLEKELPTEATYLVRPCMRYWRPFAREVVDEFVQAGVSKIIALPLYPHYSKATTGSSLIDLRRAVKRAARGLEIHEIDAYPDQAAYVEALAGRIREGLALFGVEETELIYSAHSLPRKFIEEGDPYVDHINRTIKAVEALTGKHGRIGYQSRSGPVEWLEPSTPEVLKQCAGEGFKNALLVPISFVSDHVETLYEIEVTYRRLAGDLGIRLECTKGLNDDSRFILCLKELVLEVQKN
ncbi:MAG: ferrochelatase [Desulfobulbaceae bacterium]|nr:ferrochelatase [Desulfobulbaceae bacterium]